MAGFQGKRFYLDTENSPQLAKQLDQLITQLGGAISDFLHQRVHYIITTRPEALWPPKVTDKSHHREVSREPTAVQSPINLNKNSRGSLLLSKLRTNEMKQPALPTDVLERGRLWNKKILKALEVLEFCKQHVSPQVIADSDVSTAHVKRLKGPHIKVEDNRLQHRPVYKEFADWPNINYELNDSLCPFVKKKVQKETTNDEPKESLEGLAAVKRINNNNTNIAGHSITSSYNNNNNVKVNNFNYNFNETINNNINNNTPKDGTQYLKSKLIKKRRTPAFCEICATDYDDLYEHLKSELHESFTINEDNYKELKGVIQSLPPFVDSSTTSGSGKCLQFDGQDSDASDDNNDVNDRQHSSDDEELPCSPFQSTPNMSTIQLQGSKHKSHFLRIHDLLI